MNITWLSDANYAQTSGFDADGKMPWATAVSWADGLSFGGYDDWRLPTADPACGFVVNCTGSEMGHLFYDELGGTAGSFILGSGDPDLTLFTNIQSYLYWYSTESPPHPVAAWKFSFVSGSQGADHKNSALHAWAVRDGDVAVASAPVPEPGTIILLGSGLVGLVLYRKRRHR